ncbi:SseB family protein [Glaciihabitans sp. GrIS 2.15]|uniref:SseB family protein n=1 Tax=Glaciihabitans sp. GrIS 2.15 TaxID=3071710 RepID=UPI002E03DC0E|nr:hypothetical protein [Glaciihabitans sp. GrIS 2.15]
MSDSAGVPWEGRQFEHHPASADDGSAPAALIRALHLFRDGEVLFREGEIGAAGVGEAEVINAIRNSRLLIPLVAHLGESGIDAHHHTGDKSAELSIVTVSGPDGRNVMPVFSSVDAMRRWKPLARPVPANAVRVALAAASEGTELVVLDPTSPTEFAIRRPALWAIAQSQAWIPSYLDLEILGQFRNSAAFEPTVESVSLEPGDPDARLEGPELVVHLTLTPGLAVTELNAMLERLQARWTASEIIATRVDSLRVQLGTAGA